MSKGCLRNLNRPMDNFRSDEILRARQTADALLKDIEQAKNVLIAAAAAVQNFPPRVGARQNSRRRRKSEASKLGRAMADAWYAWDVAVARRCGALFHLWSLDKNLKFVRVDTKDMDVE